MTSSPPHEEFDHTDACAHFGKPLISKVINLPLHALLVRPWFFTKLHDLVRCIPEFEDYPSEEGEVRSWVEGRRERGEDVAYFGDTRASIVRSNYHVVRVYNTFTPSILVGDLGAYNWDRADSFVKNISENIDPKNPLASCDLEYFTTCNFVDGKFFWDAKYSFFSCPNREAVREWNNIKKIGMQRDLEPQKVSEAEMVRNLKEYLENLHARRKTA
jgi:hypothetical protein